MSYTKGPWKVKPFLTPERDEDPVMVYEVEAGDLQERFDNLEMTDEGEYNEDEVTAIHAENEANAALIASCPLMAEYITMKAKEGDKHAETIARAFGWED